MKVLTGVLGILLIEWTGQPLGHTECDVENCAERVTPSVSVTYYGPGWITNLATRLSLRISSPPSVSLTFPRILPPDAEIFVSIRMGNIDRLKHLLIEGRGSVADVLAPYGISTLLLAHLHGQTEIAQLLLSAGASRVPPVNIDCPGSHMHKFWSNYSSQDYRISSSDILCDYVYQHSSPRDQVSSGLGSYTISDKSFTRLHKCILGLTYDPIEAVLPTCTDEIDVTDSLGRSALHFASYRGNFTAIELLLIQGANPNLKDRYGKAPLHIVTSFGSYSATKALIAGGADLEVRDQFESTPLHHASIMGYHNIVELLLDAGSNIDAMNCILETPIRQAILTDSIEVVQLLHQRGAALALDDNCGAYAMLKSVWCNAHRVLQYLQGLQLRVDQRHKTRGSILHTLADNGDSLTMQIFLDVKHSSLAKVDPAEVDARGWTAMDYLERRKNVDELREPFQRVLEQVKLTRQRGEALSFKSLELLKGPFERIQEVDEDDVFSDALEMQVEV
jgi:ankyrin repeat protein